jgi:single-strand DNA-binding protein
MKSLNKAMLIGNLGQDPEIRTTASGQRVARFSLATTRTWKVKDEKKEKTEWHRIVAWGAVVDTIEEFVHKGDRLYVEGEIQYGQYEDKDGVTRYTTEINLREMLMLGGPNAGMRVQQRELVGAGAGGSGGGGGSYDDFQAPPFEDDDDLPF